MKVSIQKKRNSLFLLYRLNGKRVWEALHLTLNGDRGYDRQCYDIAEKARAQRELQLISRQWDLQDPSLSRLTVADYARYVAKDMPKSYHVPKIVKYIERFSPTVSIGYVNEQWLKDFQKFLIDPPDGKRKINDITASNYYQAIKHVIHCAVRDRALLRDPSKYVRGLPCPEAQKVWLSVEELARLQAADPMGKIGVEIKRGFLFACNTGMRISDLRRLEYGMIKRGREPCIIKEQKKTRDQVTIPLNDDALSIIKDDKLHFPTEKVFPLLSASKTDPATYYREWERKAGLSFHIGWHTARHTFAVQLLIAGADIYTVSKLLGHKSIKTTEVYLKAVDPLKRAAVNRLSILA